MREAWPAALAAAFLVLAGCTSAPQEPGSGANTGGSTGNGLAPEAVQGGNGTSGGQVGNTPPVFQFFNSTLTSADNSGSSQEVWTGVVFDANSEGDLAALTVRLSGAVSLNATHTVTGPAAQSTTQPGFGADNFAVWGGSIRGDGVLRFQFRFTYPIGTAPGTVTVTPSVQDRANPVVTGPADSTSLVYFSQIVVATAPVDALGNATSTSWGLWNANAGGTNVAAANYVKLTNTGQKPAAQVVLDFTEAAFGGTTDANFSIPINGNLQFAWWEDTSPSTTRPNEGTYSFGSASADGSVTVTFSGLNNVIYVQYRLVNLPPVLAAQSYGASYTATEL